MSSNLCFSRCLQLLVLAVLLLVASVASQAWIDENGNYHEGKPKCTKYAQVSLWKIKTGYLTSPSMLPL